MRAFAMLMAAVVLAGCATNKTMVPSGGSKADGTVEMIYEVGTFEAPQVDLVAAMQQARQRCAAWGYTSAEAFGGERRQCIAWYNGGCVRETVTRTYQCTGTAQAAPG